MPVLLNWLTVFPHVEFYAIIRILNISSRNLKTYYRIYLYKRPGGNTFFKGGGGGGCPVAMGDNGHGQP